MTEAESGGPRSSGSRHEQLSALLVGLIAVIVAVLVVVEVAMSHEGSRAQAEAARLASQATTRINVSQAPPGFQLGKSLEATRVAMEGTSRQLVSLETSDAAAEAIGAADQVAWERLLAIAQVMGAVPGASSPLDPYARMSLASTQEELEALVAEQNRQVDLGDAASVRSTAAVFGLSLAALSGVLIGLAAVVGSGRPGSALLLLAYVVAGAAVAVAIVAVGWLPLP